MGGDNGVHFLNARCQSFLFSFPSAIWGIGAWGKKVICRTISARACVCMQRSIDSIGASIILCIRRPCAPVQRND